MADTQVQPKIVQVPSIGNIQFPGDMPDDQISAAIQKNFPQLAPKSALNPYQQAADKIPGGTGTSISAGTQTFEQAHPQPQASATQRFLQGAGIPTSQGETTEAVRGMLNPQADPNETDALLKKEEQIPILGGDFRARAALAKRAANETGALSAAHKIAALVPLAGPAVAAAQDEYDKGNYAGAFGAGLNALLSMEGLKAGVSPKAPELPVKTLGQETTEAATRPPVNPSPVTAPLPARTLSNILGGGPEAMAKKPLKGATAAGTASNADVAAYAKSKGIDLLPGQATGAKGLQTIQAIGERTVVSPGELPDVLDRQKAAFGNLVDDFKQRVGTEAIPNTEAAGQSLKSQAQAGLDDLKNSAQQDYQAFQDKAGDIPVDLSDVKAKAAASLASQAEALKNVPAQYANPVRNVLKKLSDLQAGPEADPATLKSFNDAVEAYGLNAEQQAALRKKLGLPDEAGSTAVRMSTAQQLRSAYLDISRDYTGNVPKSVQRYAGQAAKDIDAAMTKAADLAGATDQWRQANAKWKQLQQTYNNPEHPLYKVLQEPDPSKVPTRLLGKGSYGGSPQTVRQLQQAGIDLSPLKREVAQQIADRNFALTNGGRGLAGYSTDFLKTLYSSAEFDELTKMGRVGRAIRFEMNPSGTSNVMEGHRQIHGILSRTAGAVVGPVASRLTTSKALARAAIGDLPEVSQPRGMLDILGGKLPEPPPEPPPASGGPSTRNQGPNTPPTPKASGMAAAPRSLNDILSGGPKAAPVSDKIGGAKVLKGDVPLTGPVSPRSAEISRLQSELKAATNPKERADIQAAIDYLKAGIEGKPFNLPEQARVENLPAAQPREIDPGTYNRETKVHTPGKSQPQSVNSAVHEVLGEIPSPEHKPTAPQQPMESGRAIGGNYGNDTAVKTTSGSLPAKYKVVEADSLVPSHNAQTFAKNPQYPEGVQERDYARSKEAQTRVIQQAQNYDPAYTINTNPDAVNGPPVVTKDGIVLGGNSRSMSTQRLYKAGGGDAYKNSLRLNASQFGMTPAAIDSMKQPVLVREVETPANIEQARRIGADLNKNMTGAMGQGEKAVSAGRSVKPQTLATISGMVNDAGEGATLRDVMRQNGKDIVSMMVKDGVISDRERSQFVDTATGGLNEEGKSFVERALMGSVVDDPRLMDRVPKSTLAKLEGSLGDLAAIGARSDEYNIMPLVREALQEHAEMAMRGLDVNKYLAQSNMFGNTGNPAVEAMTRALAEKPKAFHEALQQYVQDAKFDSQGQGLLGLTHGKPSAVKAFNDAFGANLTEEQFHNAVLQSAQKEGTINSNGHPDQASGSNEGVRQASTRNQGAGSQGKDSATEAGGKTADQESPVAQRSLSDILSGKPQEKIDLNAPKSKRKIPPDVTAKADKSGNIVGMKADATDTPEFKKWFAGSKVADKDGKPLTVYHGTDQPFDRVDMSKGAQGTFWLTTDKSAVERGESGATSNAHILQAHVSIKNPAGWDEYEKKSIDELIRDGYDGIILPEGDHSNIVAFEPDQVRFIRSADKPTRSLSDILSGKKPSQKGGK